MDLTGRTTQETISDRRKSGGLPSAVPDGDQVKSSAILDQRSVSDIKTSGDLGPGGDAAHFRAPLSAAGNQQAPSIKPATSSPPAHPDRPIRTARTHRQTVGLTRPIQYSSPPKRTRQSHSLLSCLGRPIPFGEARVSEESLKDLFEQEKSSTVANEQTRSAVSPVRKSESSPDSPKTKKRRRTAADIDHTSASPPKRSSLRRHRSMKQTTPSRYASHEFSELQDIEDSDSSPSMKGIEHRVRYAVFPGDSPTTGEIKPLGPIDRTLTTSPSSLIKIFDQARRLSEEARELLEDQQMHLGLSPQPKSPHPSESQQGPDSPESRQSSNLQCVADLDSPQFRSHGCAPSRQDESINPDNVPRSPTHNVFRLTERHGRNASRLMRGCGGDGDDDSDSDPGKNRELPVSNPTPRQSSSSSSSNNGEQDEGNDSPAEAEPRTDKGNVRAAEASLGMDMASAVPTSEVIQKKLEHGARKDRRLQAEIDIISGRGENDVEHKLFQADLNKARNEKLASPSNSFIRRRDAAIQAILVRRTHIVSNDTLQSPDGLEDRLQAQVFHPRAAGGPQPAEDLPLQDVERPAKSDISALVGQAGPSEGQRSIDAIVASFVAEAPKENGSRAGKGKIS